MALFSYLDGRGVGNTISTLGLQCLLNYPTSTNTIKTYVNITATGLGASGTTIITASASVNNIVQPGELIRIGATDIYTVASVSTVTINTVETLTNTYAALSALALDKMSQWTDTSGKGNHFATTSDTNKGVFNPNQLNGGAVMTCDGVTEMLANTSTLTTLLTGDGTMFFIAKRNTETGSAQTVLFMAELGVATRGVVGFSATAGNVSYIHGGTVTSTGNTNTNYQIIGSRRRGVALGVSINNGTETTNSLATNQTPVNLISLGSAASSGLIGSVAKVLIWNRYLSNNEMVAVFRQLSNETGITIS